MPNFNLNVHNQKMWQVKVPFIFKKKVQVYPIFPSIGFYHFTTGYTDISYG